MDALVFHGPGDKKWESKPDPRLDASTDAIVRVDTTTICGTDLHILKGDVPAVTEGASSAMRRSAPWWTRATPSPTSRRGPGARLVHLRLRPLPLLPAGDVRPVPGGGGWILGHMIDGVQAEYARVPFADTSRTRFPTGVTDEHVLMLADILPTGYEVGVLNGKVQPGDVVVVVGAGPIGLAAIMTAGLFGPTPDHRHRPGGSAARARPSSSAPTRPSTPPRGRGRASCARSPTDWARTW